MQTEKNHAGEFLLSEGNGKISREVITVAAEMDLEAGTVLGFNGTNHEDYDNAAADGTETAVGILYAGVNTVGGSATKAVMIKRFAEVNEHSLVGFDAAARTDLEANHIYVR